ncbi:MAG: PIN domain-containing protein [Gemmatimonadaceae bacterium]|nr:PIN domain-containing protein [Gemmatimonadaceae bacterium]
MTRQVKVMPETNVLVSGIPADGVTNHTLTAWSTGLIRVVTSPPILEEYRRVERERSKGRAPLVGTLNARLAILTVHALR